MPDLHATHGDTPSGIAPSDRGASACRIELGVGMVSGDMETLVAADQNNSTLSHQGVPVTKHNTVARSADSGEMIAIALGGSGTGIPTSVSNISGAAVSEYYSEAPLMLKDSSGVFVVDNKSGTLSAGNGGLPASNTKDAPPAENDATPPPISEKDLKAADVEVGLLNSASKPPNDKPGHSPFLPFHRFKIPSKIQNLIRFRTPVGGGGSGSDDEGGRRGEGKGDGTGGGGEGKGDSTNAGEISQEDRGGSGGDGKGMGEENASVNGQHDRGSEDGDKDRRRGRSETGKGQKTKTVYGRSGNEVAKETERSSKETAQKSTSASSGGDEEIKTNSQENSQGKTVQKNGDEQTCFIEIHVLAESEEASCLYVGAKYTGNTAPSSVEGHQQKRQVQFADQTSKHFFVKAVSGSKIEEDSFSSFECRLFGMDGLRE
jgi:hypothetical protein